MIQRTSYLLERACLILQAAHIATGARKMIGMTMKWIMRVSATEGVMCSTSGIHSYRWEERWSRIRPASS